MITIRNGAVDKTPYLALQKSRKFKGRVFFGQHMTWNSSMDNGKNYISIGDVVSVEKPKSLLQQSVF